MRSLANRDQNFEGVQPLDQFALGLKSVSKSVEFNAAAQPFPMRLRQAGTLIVV
jgi:hypothetical protein